MMRTSRAGRDLIKQFEGLRLDAYRDPVGIWTVGYGHTPAQPGQRISHAEAEELLDADLLTAESAVRAQITAPLTQGQFDALVSFTFNLGARRLQDSTLRRLLNGGDYAGAQEEFGRWIHAGGRKLPGLVARREAEAALFGASAPPQPAPVADATIQFTEAKPMSPFIVPALNALATVLPAIKDTLFDKDKTVPERNAEAAVKLVEAAKSAIGAPNEQALVETLKSDPASHEPARKAMQAVWFDVTEAGGGGIAGAREFATEHAGGRYGRVLEVVTYCALGFLMLANLAVFGGAVAALATGSEYVDQLLNQAAIVIQADIGAALTALGFWLGSSVAKNRGIEVKTP